MGVIVVKLGRRGPRRSPLARAPAAEVPAATVLPLWLTGASLASPAVGAVIVFASLLTLPTWLRVALIVIGALIGLAGLAVLAADACRDVQRPRGRQAGA